MPSRKHFKGVAFGFAGHFVSRNNDIFGYWAMGQLYKHALENSSSTIKIDLLSQTISPSNQAFKYAVNAWNKRFLKTIENLAVPTTWVTNASITIIFEKVSVSEDGVQRAADEYLGAAFTCAIEIIDDLHRKRVAIMRGRCRPHDPSREYKSARA